MTPLETGTGFTLKRVQELLGLSRTTIAGLISEGFVTPVRGDRNGHRFSFQDLMLLRTAHSLQTANIPPRRILKALSKLKADLPAELPLTGLRITAVGSDVAVRDRSGQWNPESGQLLMDFEVADVAGGVSFLPRIEAPGSTDWFERGNALEATDRAAAEDAFRRAIALQPSRAAPYLNLGALLCEDGRYAEAEVLYASAAGTAGPEPRMHFNHALALEDLGRPEEALGLYRRALEVDPDFADAHYNLAILLERRGDEQSALRHFSAYRRLG